MRKQIVAGNWKMNKTAEEAVALTSEIVNMVADEVTGSVEVVLCVPFIYLPALQRYVGGRISVGAQNCHQKASGAYTGEISAPMLKSLSVPYVILGHSERRQYFGETDALLAEKVDIALANGLKPIFCCGESLEQRQNEDYLAIIRDQVTNSLFHLSAEQFGQVVIAYEPIWAIGTGLTASADQAQEVHAAIRSHIASKYGAEVADNTTIQYGGSVNAANAAELFACPDVDGGLVGGASLKSRDFVDIIKAIR
ncbi:MAG: triose-phosphate isomerase [Siphonobacter aquaeclarae]|nr:triose-phosphate isomerase [Siphonobacter aquaeclarae]